MSLNIGRVFGRNDDSAWSGGGATPNVESLSHMLPENAGVSKMVRFMRQRVSSQGGSRLHQALGTQLQPSDFAEGRPAQALLEDLGSRVDWTSARMLDMRTGASDASQDSPLE